MLRNIILLFGLVLLVGCNSSREATFQNMSEAELAAYNESVSQSDQVVCLEGVRRGTVGLVRKVCTSAVRMARLTNRSNNSAFNSGVNDGFYGSRSFYNDRALVPQVFFSPPPPGYTTPIIHVRDPRR